MRSTRGCPTGLDIPFFLWADKSQDLWLHAIRGCHILAQKQLTIESQPLHRKILHFEQLVSKRPTDGLNLAHAS